LRGIIAGKAGHVNYEAIASIIYTNPELAGVGLTENQAKEQGIEVRIRENSRSAPTAARFAAMTSKNGQVRRRRQNRSHLGAHILHHAASELIAEAVSVIEFGGSSEDIGRTTHSHPTLSEAVREKPRSMSKNARCYH